MDELTPVVMLKVHGETEDSQWFEYLAGYFDTKTMIEWDKGTMRVELPAQIAKWLIGNGHARALLPSEVQAPKKEPEKPPVEPPAPKPKKGESND